MVKFTSLRTIRHTHRAHGFVVGSTAFVSVPRLRAAGIYARHAAAAQGYPVAQKWLEIAWVQFRAAHSGSNTFGATVTHSGLQINAEYNAAAKAYAALKHTNDTTAVSAAYQRLTAARSQLQASVR
jgi:hypothetical protein